MKIKLPFIIITAFALLGIIVVISGVLTTSKITQQFPQAPTSIPVPSQAQIAPNESIAIVSTNPPDESTKIPLDQQITITFTKRISTKDFVVRMNPQTDVTVKSEGTKLIIIPNQALQQNTLYSYAVIYQNTIPLRAYSFTTVGENPVIQPDTNSNANQLEQDYDKQYAPDIFLYNYMPYDGTDFSVTGDFTSAPKEHFFFTVSLTGQDTNQSKQDFLDWLKSIGLQDQQIQQLDIHYQ